MKNSKNSQDALHRERPPFTMIENAIIEDERVSRQALLVYWVLCKHADNKNGECWPGFTRISKIARYSRPKVISAIEELVDFGYILKECRVKDGDPKTHLRNKYTILRQYDYQKVSQGSVETLPGVVKPLNHPSKASLPKLYSKTRHKELEREGASSPSSNSPEKEPSLFAKLVEIRKKHFAGLGDLQRQFTKNADEFDALSNDDKAKVLDAYGKYLADNSDEWINKRNHSFAYFWKYRDKWYAVVDPREKEERETGKLRKDYYELRRELKQISLDEAAFPGLSTEEQAEQRAAAPGHKLPWETDRKAKLIAHAKPIGRQLRELSSGCDICPVCGEDYLQKVCRCGFMEPGE